MDIETLPNEIKIPLIKGEIPNFIDARASIADLQAQENKRAETRGDVPRKVIYCQFCGRSQKSMQALRGHLRFCQNKRAYQKAVNDGVTFRIGNQVFVVAARSIKLFTGLEKYERFLNNMVREDNEKLKVAVLGFNSLIHGASLAQPEGWVKLVRREAFDGD